MGRASSPNSIHVFQLRIKKIRITRSCWVAINAVLFKYKTVGRETRSVALARGKLETVSDVLHTIWTFKISSERRSDAAPPQFTQAF